MFTTTAALQCLHCIHYCICPAVSTLCTLLHLPCSVYTVHTTAPAPHRLHCTLLQPPCSFCTVYTTAVSLQRLPCAHYCNCPIASALCSLLHLPHIICTVHTTAASLQHFHTSFTYVSYSEECRQSGRCFLISELTQNL